jgi:DNA polymerase II large subunit
MALCDGIEGPIVELQNGTVTAVHDAARAAELVPEVRRIHDLGQLLVSFGEFLENNRPLSPGSYTLDWHLEELRSAGVDVTEKDCSPTYAEAVEMSHLHGVPLHPRFLLFWHDLEPNEIAELSRFVESSGQWEEDHLVLPADPSIREMLIRLGFLFHLDADGELRGEPNESAGLIGGLGLEVASSAPIRRAELEPIDPDPIAFVSRLAGVAVPPRSPSRIGGRVGRPEKARQRKMSPNVHALFPLGDSGGATRSLLESARRTLSTGVVVSLGLRQCPGCGKNTVWLRCACGVHTEPVGRNVNEPLPVAPIWAEALRHLHLPHVPEVKGVKGLISKGKVPEMIEKGILRASHGISVYQDGTARFDLTDLPLTHFRPREIGLPIAKAHELGYTIDWAGEPLTDPDQLVEMRPQDLIVSYSCGQYLTQLAQCVDDELVRLYDQPPFYQVRRPEDLRGHILVALAPHTSGGVAGRVIGYTEAEVCFAHPVFHAAKRRNCDGDEDSVTLLMDSLLNFSRSYLPESRGALMDKPLVLTTRLNLDEVDKEAHNLDIVTHYPLALYRAAVEGRSAKEVETLIDTLGHRADAPVPLAGLGFTHDTRDIAAGPVRSAYREAGSMNRIVEQSLMLTAQIRAVQVADAVALVLNSHFLPDLMGNLKSYATQKFRCKVCGMSYRRPPLTGRCAKPTTGNAICDGELLPTVYEGAVRKYLGLSQRLAETGGIPPYLRQRIQLLESSLATIFPGTAAQTTLERFRSVEVAPEVPGPE